MINSNLPPILHRFRDIASERSKIATFFYHSLVYPFPPTEGFPWDDLRKIIPGCRQVTNVLNGAVRLPKISIGLVGCTNVTGRQTTDRRTTDRQTDGRRHIANMNMSSRSLKMIGGGRPFVPEILDRNDRVPAKSPIFHLFSLVAPQP